MKYIIRFSIFNFFWSDWIRCVQNGSNLIKFDFWWNNHSNMIIYSILLIFWSELIRSVKILIFLIKMDQTWSNCISDEIIGSLQYIIKFSNLFIYWSDLIRSVQMDQNGSKWIKMDQIRFLMKWSLKYIIRLTLFIFWSDLI